MENVENKNGVTLSRKEAEEYCAYKRQKKISEIMSAMRRSESELTHQISGVKLCERASRIRQTSVRMTPSDLSGRGEIFKQSPLKIDCIVGGNGETFAKVKAYEAKCAIRSGAKELTLILTPSLLENCRYQELRKEVRRVCRAAGKIPVKARVEKVYPQSTLTRLARLCSEMGVKYFSVPYFAGCHLLQSELSGGCSLEVYGVEKLAEFKEMTGAGMGRVVTSRAWEIYTEWLKEVEEIIFSQPLPAPKVNPTPVLPSVTAAALAKGKESPKKVETHLPNPTAAKPPVVAQKDGEMDYHCHLENGKLKFS